MKQEKKKKKKKKKPSSLGSEAGGKVEDQVSGVIKGATGLNEDEVLEL